MAATTTSPKKNHRTINQSVKAAAATDRFVEALVEFHHIQCWRVVASVALSWQKMRML
jgi:hypothetical protein